MAEQIVIARKKTVPITQQPRITGKICRAFGFYGDTHDFSPFLVDSLIIYGGLIMQDKNVL